MVRRYRYRSACPKYVKYWIDEVNDLKNELKGIDYALVTSQAEELKKIEFIQLHINDFMKTVADRNNPDLSQAIDDVVRRVQASSIEVAFARN